MPSALDVDSLAESLEGRRIRSELESRLFGRAQPSPRIGQYSLQHRLGQGGMGTVYAATDPQTGQSVAIKVVPTDKAQAIDRLRREAKAMANLEHPNIVTVHEVGTCDDGLYLVMDLVEGQTLAAWANAGRAWPEIVALGLQVADALGAAHDLGIVHRDVKPENILVDTQGQARLVDFGLAKPLPGSEADNLSQFTESLTDTGVVVGTMGYIAPEQLLGLSVGPSCDQFSLCATLFEILFGVRPFDGKTGDAVAMAIVTGDVSAVPDEVEVPASVAAALRQGMGATPAERFASMKDLAEALRKAMEAQGSGRGSGRGSDKGSDKRRWWSRRRRR
ncbi:MAG: serine/threonine-protein kinase [Myxococcota bacterium]